MNKKKNIITLVIVISLLMIISLIAILKPFNLSKLKGEVITPANPAFDDIDFYSCVVQSYKSLESSEETQVNPYDLFDTYEGIPYMATSQYNNEYISDDELKKVTNVHCNSYVNSLKGIEKLTNLEALEVNSYNSYTEGGTLDLSNNEKLNTLSIYYATFDNINLSKNKELESLTIAVNDNLESIDLSSNVKLKNLMVFQTGLKTINLENNTNLTQIDLRQNNLTELDISNIPPLYFGNYYWMNNISSIKFNPSSTTYDLDGQANGFKNIDFGNDKKMNIKNDNYKISGDSIIINGEPSVEEFISNLGLRNLTVKVCSNSSCSKQITEGIITEEYYVIIPELNDLEFDIILFNSSYFDNYYLYRNIISEYNSANPSKRYTVKNDLTEEELITIKSLSYFPYTKGASFKGIEKLTGLTNLTLMYAPTDFDSKSYPNLQNLNISNSNINNIDLSNNKALTNLVIQNCYNLTDIKGLNNLTNLTNLTINQGKLESIDISSLHELINLSLENNSLKSLDITKNKKLESLSIAYNLIEELDTSNNPNLTSLVAKNNKLKKLDFTNNLLTEGSFNYTYGTSSLDLSNNELTEIKALGNVKIPTIILNNNKLTSIDVTGNDLLTNLEAGWNNLKTVKGLDTLENLQSLFLFQNPISKDTAYVIAGTSKEHIDKIKLPSNFSLDIYNEDDGIATYEKDVITGLSSGQTTVTKFSAFKQSSEETFDLPMRLYIRVYDIKSSKYVVNKDDKYIYVGTEDNDKAIKRYVKVSGPDAKKELSNNKIKILDDDKTVETYDIIKISSNKYDLNKDEITHSKSFDVNSIKVTNGTVNVIGNQLQILHNDVIVKTFELKEAK